MLFYYIRHGEPIYDPDMLTDHGRLEAEALGEKLSRTGLDRIYTSTSNRAMQTAEPAARFLGITPERLDFANEHYTWLDFTLPNKDGIGAHWVFQDDEATALFASRSIRDLGDRWYEHPAFEGCRFKEGLDRVYRETDSLMASLGYEHERYTGRYVETRENNERVALFAHQGFGFVFLSCLLDIPYPIMCTRFDMCHSGVTVIDFRKNREGFCIPCVLTLSSDSHLYAKGITGNYGAI